MKKLTVLLFSILIIAPFMANAISLVNLRSEIQDKEKQLTTLQFKTYFLGLVDTKVNWSGKVVDVVSSSHNGTYFVYDITHNMKETNDGNFFRNFRSDREIALALNKNQEYNFYGKIRSCSLRWKYLLASCSVDITGFNLLVP